MPDEADHGTGDEQAAGQDQDPPPPAPIDPAELARIEAEAAQDIGVEEPVVMVEDFGAPR